MAEAIIIGREEDKEAIIDLLLSSKCEKDVSVIAIVGIGGLGKTTLAKLVYNEETVRMHFELRKWVCTPDDFDVKLIVEELVSSEGRIGEMEALRDLLHQQIKGKKYLMVLDDVWKENFEKWSQLKDLLAYCARGSKILITTRFREVAEATGPADIYQLKGLSEEKSWSLFKRIAFEPWQQPNPNLVRVGMGILAKCYGVPLAIRAMGGCLYLKDSESDWLYFIDKEQSRIDEIEYNNISINLRLSYWHLPWQLKQCFAYCKLFPRGYKIKVEMLIQLWIAQGYVQLSDPNESLEDVGVRYFSHLHWGSFFQEVEKDVFGNYTTCKMHDLMHQLSVLVAGEEYALSSNDEVGVSNANARHASFHFDWYSECRVSPSLFKGNKLRTLLLDGERSDMKEQECIEMFSYLRCLRVLGLPGLQIGSLPSPIDNLQHVRYLDLSGSLYINTLPNSITNMINLKVLKLNGCCKLTQLPRDMRKLVNLMHLENEHCYMLSHIPRGVGQLTSLEKLSEFVVAEDSSGSQLGAGLQELHGLNKLRGSLRIRKLGRVENGAIECKAANLKEKQHLQNLELQWKDPLDRESGSGREVENEEMELESLEPHQYLEGLSMKDYRGMKLPSWFSSLTKLVVISFLSCCNIKCLPLSPHLPFLKKLVIDDLGDLEHIDVAVRGDYDCEGGTSLFFPSLQQLILENCPHLKGWNVENPLHFPSLSYLKINSCPHFTSMPRSPSLKKLECLGSTAKSLEQILKAATVASESIGASSSSSSSQLNHLRISSVDDLEFLPMVLLSNLTSLHHLEIFSCSRIEKISRDDEDDAWKGLQSLCYLELTDVPNLVSLPLGLQYLTSLRRFQISQCPQLNSLPFMPNLSSLENLSIQDCPIKLEIIDHISNVTAGGRDIKRNGLYLF